ncbi:cobalt-precorrin-6A reductase [Actinoplanes sp. RD1]|uniref:cobalt-precorrin-6A reductase n=1 Tax=Actinoplanes sp. RD1 TaxID=3064538 RepID=UPI002740EA8E|nr:cobalt-precorrin-6A reductase [Actinoplanes sp. RD1]
MSSRRVLLLSGTTEGRRLAGRTPVISSLAGRTRSPLLPPGEVRIGGFGGVEGLIGYLRSARIDAVIDATHPFAAAMTSHAAAACAATGVPLLILRRPGWTPVPGDRWHRVPSLPAAAALLPSLGERVFLTTGRQSIAAFAGVPGCWFLSRSVEPPEPPMPSRLEVLLDRGPFTPESEHAVLTSHAIDVLVTKDSGGSAAKLDAARALGIPVVVVDRPPLPGGIPVVPSVDAALTWLDELTA